MLNSQWRLPSVLALALCCLTTVLSGADAPQHPLWHKAVAVAEGNADWLAGLVISRFEAHYKGESVGVNELWQRSRLGEQGEIITETVKRLEDGKDVTNHEKAKRKKKNDSAQTANKGGGSPFDPGVQDRVSLKATDRSRIIAGRNCVSFVFELTNTNGPTTRGTAWLDKETGIPTEIENMTVDPLPDKHLKCMVLTTRYETTTNGGWHLRMVETTGTVRRMFINADFRSTATFSEYWKKPQTNSQQRPAPKAVP